MAFKKLEAVGDIKIEKGKKPGTQTVVFNSKKSDLTKDDAVKSLGKKASRYVVKDFKKG